MSTLGELFAAQRIARREDGDLMGSSLRSMADDLHVDSLRYLEVGEIAAAIGVPEETLCLGCVNAHYPTAGGRRLLEAARAMLRAGEGAQRVFG